MIQIEHCGSIDEEPRIRLAMAGADESGDEVFLSLDDDGPVVPVKKKSSLNLTKNNKKKKYQLKILQFLMRKFSIQRLSKIFAENLR